MSEYGNEKPHAPLRFAKLLRNGFRGLAKFITRIMSEGRQWMSTRYSQLRFSGSARHEKVSAVRAARIREKLNESLDAKKAGKTEPTTSTSWRDAA